MGSGHIEQLASGAFRVAVYAGKDPITGKKQYLKETHPTEPEAATARDRLLAQVEAEATPDRTATVAVLMERWTEVADHGLVTRDTTAGIIRRTINPALGDMTLRKLQHRVDILDRLYTHLRRCNVLCDGRPFVQHAQDGEHNCEASKCRPHRCKPMAASSVRRVHSILSASLGYAVSWGWIERNPAEHAHPPKLQRRRARPPEAEQVARLLNLAWQTSVEFGLFLWLATTTGARRGELAGLRWEDIKVELGIVLVRKNYVQRGGQRELKVTKSDADRRLSLDPLTVQMRKDFRQQRADQLAPGHLTVQESAFVFSPDPLGVNPWHPDHFTHEYRKLTDVLGIAEPLKNLRHFNATQLLAAGVDLRTTAGRLGHSDGGATTLKVYADWAPATDRKAAERLAADLAALRAVQASEGGSDVLSTATPLTKLGRPIEEVLDPPLDGRTTYFVVAQALRAAISAGKLEPGDLLPSASELAAWYCIARSTALRAVTALTTEGRAVRRGQKWMVAGF